MFHRLRDLLAGSPKQRLMKVLGNAPLPVMRPAAMKALSALRDPNLPLGKVGELIASDPGLSVAILRQANSANSGLRRKVPDVRHAVSLLGRGTVESIVVGQMVRDAVPNVAAPGFNPDRFWQAASRRSTVARELGRVLDPPNAMLAGTAALLQDVAVPLLAQRQTDHYSPVLERWHRAGGDLAEAEKETFGWDHSNVGEWLCESWGLPSELVDLISSHHTPEQGAAPVVLVSTLSEEPDDTDIERLIDMAQSAYGTRPEAILGAIERAGLMSAAGA